MFATSSIFASVTFISGDTSKSKKYASKKLPVASKIAYKNGMQKEIIANFFPKDFVLPLTSFASKIPNKTTPMTIKITLTKANWLIVCFSIKKQSIAVIAPAVFSIGSEIDSAKNLIPKYEKDIDKI